jgi:hypothetical protein
MLSPSGVWGVIIYKNPDLANPRRDRNPHKGGSGGKYDFQPITDLTAEELEAYHAGFDYNEQSGCFKY